MTFSFVAPLALAFVGAMDSLTIPPDMFGGPQSSYTCERLPATHDFDFDIDIDEGDVPF